MFCCFYFEQNFTKATKQEATRCDTRANLIAQGCDQKEIISPENIITTVKKNPLSESFTQEEPVQLSPQVISLKLRPGK